MSRAPVLLMLDAGPANVRLLTPINTRSAHRPIVTTNRLRPDRAIRVGPIETPTGGANHEKCGALESVPRICAVRVIP